MFFGNFHDKCTANPKRKRGSQVIDREKTLAYASGSLSNLNYRKRPHRPVLHAVVKLLPFFRGVIVPGFERNAVLEERLITAEEIVPQAILPELAVVPASGAAVAQHGIERAGVWFVYFRHLIFERRFIKLDAQS